MKKMLCLLLSFVMLLGTLPVSVLPVGAKVVSSGQDGTISWTLNDAGTLTFSGTGELRYGIVGNTYPVKKVVIKSGVTSIAPGAFIGFYRFTSITIPNSVTYIGDDAFLNCYSLTNVTIPNSVTYIGDSAFYDCGLTNVTIPNSVTYIGDYAFCNCANLRSVTIPNGVTSIGEGVFESCWSLTNVMIPNGVTSIGECAFEDCYSLANVTIPGSVKEIGESAFCGCAGLTELTISNGVKSIGQEAFKYCTGLTSLNIPSSVTEIYAGYGDYGLSFYECSGLESITVDPGNEFYFSVNNCLVRKQDNMLICGCKNSVIPSDGSVKYIGYAAFSGCTGLTNITIPGSVHSINNAAFSGCTGLTSIMISNGVESIGPGAFASCTGLTSLNIPSSVTEIWGAFVGNCPSLESITVDPENAFYFSVNNCLVRKQDHMLICGCKNSVIPVNGSVNSIGDSAFSSCKSLTNVTIPGSVKEIGESAFCGCTGLTKLTISNGVKSIGEEAFANCSSLMELTLTNSVKELGYDAFYGCNEEHLSIYFIGTKKEWKALDFPADQYAHLYILDPNSPFLLAQRTISVYVGYTESITINRNLFEAPDTRRPWSSEDGVVWTSADPTVAEVTDRGKVTGRKVGETVITVSTLDGLYSEKCRVTVKKPIPVKGITVDSEVLNLFTDETDVIDYKIQPANATNRSVSCTVSDPKILSVSQNGFIKAKAAGETTVTLKTEDGGFTATKKVKVTAPTEVSFKIDDEEGTTALAFSVDWLRDDSVNYNHKLARFCAQTAMLGYTDDGTIRNGVLKKLGFDSKNAVINLKTDKNSVNHIFASKKMKINGKNTTVVLAGFIGSRRDQWITDFESGMGEIHQGFKEAKDNVAESFYAFLNQSLGSDKHPYIIFFGHSRGAAVANLMAADFIDSELFAEKGHIFTYAFATPAYSREPESIRNKKDYQRIFNIVNPEDFVTRVMPAAWGYGKYGTTFTLPCITYDLNSWARQFDRMEEYYFQYTGRYCESYKGTAVVNGIINHMVSYVHNVSDYYKPSSKTPSGNSFFHGDSLYAYFHNGLTPMIAGKEHWYEIIPLFQIAGGLVGTLKYTSTNFDLFTPIDSFFCDNINKFYCAHKMPTYTAYMQSLSEYELYKDRGCREITGACPVDIEVMDIKTGEVVAKITDDQVDETVAAGENALYAAVESDRKIVHIPLEGDYEVKIIGTGEGTMDFTETVIDGEGVAQSRANILDVPVEKDYVLYAEHPAQENDAAPEEVALITEFGGMVADAQLLPPEAVAAYEITAKTEGVGTVDGAGTYIEGDWITLSAGTDEQNEFLGFYENGKLLTKEPTLTFIADKDRNITAKFTNRTVAATGVVIDREQKTEYLLGEDPSTFYIAAAVQPADSTDRQVVWSSSDASVAEITPDGVVTLIAPGTVTLTVTAADGKYKDSVTLTVSDGSAPAYAVGDVDGNGQVLANDARLALRASAKLETLDVRQTKAADVDGNGQVLANDARQILRYSAKLQHEFEKAA